MFAQGEIKEKTPFYLNKETIITPSAKTFLLEKDITIQTKENELQEQNAEGFQTLFGAKLSEKPEFMTHLKGNVLVFKDHPRIAFRGVIDSLESEIILAQIFAQEENLNKMIEDLEEIIAFIRKLIRCEVSGERFEEFYLQSLSAADLREHSHHPNQYYGMKHFLPTYKQGKIVAVLNGLRTKTREAEIVAYKAFKDEQGQVFREDIIRALNRLSSLFWIMMFKYLTNKYK